MKKLKLLSTGLMLSEGFSDSILHPPLINNADLDFVAGHMDIVQGNVALEAFRYENIVLEIQNSFVPINVTDKGGLSIHRGAESRELYEAIDPQSAGTVPHVRIVKTGDVFTGYSSEDGYLWNSVGSTIFPYAETIQIDFEGYTPYRVNRIKLYASDKITIHGLLPGWRVYAYQGTAQVGFIDSIGESIDFQLPYYPFTGRFKIYNDVDVVVSDYVLSDAWGGDNYELAVNVDIYNEYDNIITLAANQHLGKMYNEQITYRFKAKNNDPEETIINIQPAVYSNFASWVSMAMDEAEEPGVSVPFITLAIPANGELYFWVRILRPYDLPPISAFDFRNKECLFYLEVF